MLHRSSAVEALIALAEMGHRSRCDRSDVFRRERGFVWEVEVLVGGCRCVVVNGVGRRKNREGAGRGLWSVGKERSGKYPGGTLVPFVRLVMG